MATHAEIEETLTLIRNAWRKAPKLRLCQLLSNLAHVVGWKDNDLFYIEDTSIRKGLKQFTEKIKYHE